MSESKYLASASDGKEILRILESSAAKGNIEIYAIDASFVETSSGSFIIYFLSVSIPVFIFSAPYFHYFIINNAILQVCHFLYLNNLVFWANFIRFVLDLFIKL